MKYMKAQKLLCLILTLTLMTGMLMGCLSGQFEDTLPAEDTKEPTIGHGTVKPTVGDEILRDAMPNDPFAGMNLPWSAEKISLFEAWDITTGSPTIRVGIIDSGVDSSHPELRNRINVELSESFVPGYSALEDATGHGTHIAGIIGAQGNNELGLAGVCWDVEIVSLRALGEDSDGYSLSEKINAVIAAIRSANEKGIHILNISLSTEATTFSEDLESAMSEFNGLIVCSAGNTTSENSHTADNDIFEVYPANLNLDNLITVGASTNADTLWAYSCYGHTTVDIFAPGNSILSCYPEELCRKGKCDTLNHILDGYHIMSGTSMAAPHVAGVAALMLSIHPDLTPAELKYILLDTVDIILDDDSNDVFGEKCVSGGRLNAYKALTSPSLHNYGLWYDSDLTYHIRTCTCCGHVQYQTHQDCWDDFKNMCMVCKRTGIVSGGIMKFFPIEEENGIPVHMIFHKTRK